MLLFKKLKIWPYEKNKNILRDNAKADFILFFEIILKKTQIKKTENNIIKEGNKKSIKVTS